MKKHEAEKLIDVLLEITGLLQVDDAEATDTLRKMILRLKLEDSPS